MSKIDTTGLPRVKLAEAIAAMRDGKRVTNVEWVATDPNMPDFVVLIPGRELEVTFEPMVSYVGKGTKMLSREHIDGIFINSDGKVEIAVGWGGFILILAELSGDTSKLPANWVVLD